MKKHEAPAAELVSPPWDLFRQNPTIVVKYGGAAMIDHELQATFARSVATLAASGAWVTVVHGGGDEATRMARRLGIETRFVEGQRYTDEEMLEVIVMILAGTVNKRLVGLLSSAGATAVGLSGADGRLLRARRLSTAAVDLGLVGEIVSADADLLRALMRSGRVPVVAPLAAGIDAPLYNVNADLAATAIAQAAMADHLVFMSDVPGILVDGEVVPSLTVLEAESLIDSGAISGGMIPKVRSCIDAIVHDVRSVHVIDGRSKTALLDLAAGRRAGTRITPDIVETHSLSYSLTTIHGEA